jgi:hypothetical protein
MRERRHMQLGARTARRSLGLVLAGLAIVASLLLAAGSAGFAASSEPLVVLTWRLAGPPPPSGSSTYLDLTVYPTGRAALISDAPAHVTPSFSLSRSTLGTLRADLARARFGALRRLYTGTGGPETTVIHAGRTVRLSRGARGPLRLRPLVTLLERIIGSRGGWAPGP